MSFIREYLAFVRASRKWWLMPVLILLLLMVALVILEGSIIAPFIYTLF